MERIGLAQAIKALRLELEASIQDAEGEELRFRVGEVELEYQIAPERSATANGGIRFLVVEFGGEGSQASTKTHVVKTPLTPINASGEPVVTGLLGDVVPE